MRRGVRVRPQICWRISKGSEEKLTGLNSEQWLLKQSGAFSGAEAEAGGLMQGEGYELPLVFGEEPIGGR
jgi:hypothetical protein